MLQVATGPALIKSLGTGSLGFGTRSTAFDLRADSYDSYGFIWIHVDSYGFIRSVLEAVDSVIDNGPSHGHPKAALTESEAAFPSFPRAHEQAEGEGQRRAI